MSVARAAAPRAEPAPFLRPDGKEKVTGSGRYTADINLTGQLHAQVPLRGPLACAHPPHRHGEGAGAPRRARRPDARGRPDVLYGNMVKDRRLFAKDMVRYEGDVVAGGRRATPELAEAGRRRDRGRVRAAAGGQRHRGGARRRRPLIHETGSRTRRDEERGRDGNVARLFDHREGRRGRSHGRGRRRRPAALRRRRLAGSADRAARDARGVARRPRHGLDIDAGAVRRAGGRRHVLQIPESQVRVVVPLLGGGFGAKCDFHFEGQVAALARAARRR